MNAAAIRIGVDLALVPDSDPAVIFDAEITRALDLAITRSCLPEVTPADHCREQATAPVRPADCISGTDVQAGATPSFPPFLTDEEW